MKAMEYLDSYSDTNRPFFLYIAYQAVHSPLMISKDWLATSKCDQKGFNDDNREMLCAMMTQVDFWQSSLVDHLKEMGVWHNTLYIFLSDNGANPGYGGSNSPLRGEKGQYWDGGVKSPVFMAGGYTTRALREAGAGHSAHLNTDLMHITDLPATVLSLAGVPVDDLDGVDQWAAITTTNSTEVRNDLVININSEMYGLAGAIRVGKFKYIKTPEPEEDTMFWLLIKKVRARRVEAWEGGAGRGGAGLRRAAARAAARVAALAHAQMRTARPQFNLSLGSAGRSSTPLSLHLSHQPSTIPPYSISFI